MRIDNNLYEKSIKILTDLISFKTISGSDNSKLIDYCEKILNDLNIETFKVFDDEKKRVNLFGTLKAKKTNGKNPITKSNCVMGFSNIKKPQMEFGEYNYSKIPDDPLVKLFYLSVGIMGVYILFEALKKANKKK